MMQLRHSRPQVESRQEKMEEEIYKYLKDRGVKTFEKKDTSKSETRVSRTGLVVKG